MKHTSIKLKSLITLNELDVALEQIENDFRNYVGGHARWVTGKECILLASAKTKVNSINVKYWKMAELQGDMK